MPTIHEVRIRSIDTPMAWNYSRLDFLEKLGYPNNVDLPLKFFQDPDSTWIKPYEDWIREQVLEEEKKHWDGIANQKVEKITYREKLIATILPAMVFNYGTNPQILARSSIQVADMVLSVLAAERAMEVKEFYESKIVKDGPTDEG